MALAIGIVGLVLALAALPWLKSPLEKTLRWIRGRYLDVNDRLHGLPDDLAKAHALRSGLATHYLTDFMVVEWRHDVNVNLAGHAENIIDCTVVNQQEIPTSEIKFPIYLYYDEQSKRPESLNCWAKIGRNTYTLEPLWDPVRRVGFLRIPFPAVVIPRGNVRIRLVPSTSHLRP